MSLSDALADYPVIVEVPVAWGEMDAYQHVNNATYFRYFENARIAYFDRTGVIDALRMPQGVGPILAETSCRYRAPVTYPDTLHIGARVTELGDDRFQMAYAVYSEHAARITTTGGALVVAFDYAANTKAAVPDAWRQAFESLEGGPLPVLERR